MHMRIARLFAVAALAAFALPAAAVEDAQTTKPSMDAVVSPAADVEAADASMEKGRPPSLAGSEVTRRCLQREEPSPSSGSKRTFPRILLHGSKGPSAA